MTKKKTFGKKCRRFIFRSLLYIILGFFVFTLSSVLVYKYVPVYYTPLMFIRQMQAWQTGEHLHIRKEWVPIQQISPNMVRAVIASEDNLFTHHWGFSQKAIQQAWEDNKSGKRIRGGSTITQQTAKNVFLTPSRTYVRKAFELYYSLLIECIWGKERIMEVYLNVIEMGDGIFGVEAASEIYFNTTAKNLTKSQSALLAVCLPNPHKMSPAHPSAYVRKRQAQILVLMPKLGKIELVRTPLERR